MDRYNITLKKASGEGFVKETTARDSTTHPRFSKRFEVDLNPDVAVDYPIEFEKWQIVDIEMQVKNWLDEKGAEEPSLEITNIKQQPALTAIIFRRSEIAFKDCGNVWIIYHIARSNWWPRIISSRPKVEVKKDFDDYMTMKNEIRELSYSDAEERIVQEARKIIEDLNDMPF
jgi:hypothetical protein